MQSVFRNFARRYLPQGQDKFSFCAYMENLRAIKDSTHKGKDEHSRTKQELPKLKFTGISCFAHTTVTLIVLAVLRLEP